MDNNPENACIGEIAQMPEVSIQSWFLETQISN